MNQSLSWERRLEHAWERFESAWRDRPETPPDLATFLAVDTTSASGAPTHAEDVAVWKRQLLLELVRLDIEFRWRTRFQSGGMPCAVWLVEEYAARFADVLGAPTAVDIQLIAEEYRARQRFGDSVAHGEYLARFPDRAAEVAAALAQIDSENATCAPSASSAFQADGSRARRLLADVRPPFPTIDGYEILSELGRGGMGVVYAARDAALNRMVAIKMILAGGAAGADRLARFRRETEAVARLRHPHIVQIHEVGEVDGMPYCVLEHVGGGSLDRVLAQAPLEPRQAARLTAELADAMHYAHQMGIVHRDLKPANVLLEHAATGAESVGDRGDVGSPKITDFGLARQLDQDSGQTQSGHILGSPSYMAPEQARGEARAAGPPVDVYAVGAVLYECITGRPPFKGATLTDTLSLVCAAQPVAPRALQPSCPRDLETICLRCLQKDAARRYATAGALASDLRAFLDGRPIQARPVGQLERTWLWTRRNPKLAAALIGLATLSLIAVAAFVIASWQYLERDSRQLAQASLTFDRGVRLCREGDSGQGLLYMVRALAESPAGAQDLQDAIRREIAVERRGLHALEHVFAHAGMIRAATFDATGALLALGDDKGIVRIVDARSLQERHVVDLKEYGEFADDRSYSVAALLFPAGPDELLIAINGGRVFRMNPQTGELAGEPIKHAGRPMSLAFVAASNELIVAGQAERTGDVSLAHYSLDGSRTPEQAGAIRPQGALYAVAASAEGRWLATGGMGRVAEIWEARTAQRVAAFAHPGPVFCLCFHPTDAILATGCLDGKVRLWHVPSGSPRGPPMVHLGPIRSLDFSRDGRFLLAGGEDGAARLWEVRDPNRYRIVGQPLYHLSDVRCVAIAPQAERFLTVGFDRIARLWNLTPEPDNRVEFIHPAPVSCATFSADGQRLFTACLDSEAERGKAYLWSRDGSALATFDHGSEVLAAGLQPGGERLAFTAGNNGLLKLWDARDGRLLREWNHGGVIFTANWSADGKVLAFAGRGPRVSLIRLPASTDGEVGDVAAASSMEITDNPVGSWVWNVAFDALQRYLLTDGGISDGPRHEARLWDVRTGQRVGAAMQHANEVRGTWFNRGGDRVLTCSFDGVAGLWRVPDGQPIALLKGHAGQVSTGAFSPDDRWIATGGADGTARIWSATDGRLMATIAHDKWVRVVAFSPDARTLATGGDDGGVRLWRVPDGTSLGVALWHGGPVTRIAFQSDNRGLLTAGKDARACLWTLPAPSAATPAELSREFQSRLGMKLENDGGVRVLDADAWSAMRQATGD